MPLSGLEGEYRDVFKPILLFSLIFFSAFNFDRYKLFSWLLLDDVTTVFLLLVNKLLPLLLVSSCLLLIFVLLSLAPIEKICSSFLRFFALFRILGTVSYLLLEFSVFSNSVLFNLKSSFLNGLLVSLSRSWILLFWDWNGLLLLAEFLRGIVGFDGMIPSLSIFKTNLLPIFLSLLLPNSYSGKRSALILKS